MTLATEAPPVIGHRGAAGHAPENTLASVRRARALGATWVEVDVKLTRDGVPVLFHDDDLKRTTDGQGPVAAHTLAELAERDAGSWYGAQFAGEPIPTLEGLVAVLDELGMGLNLELKPCPGRARETGHLVGRAFARMWPTRLPAAVISSFQADALAACAEAAPELARAFLVHRLPADWAAVAAGLGAAAIHCDVKYLKHHEVAEILAAGLAVRCYTVNDGTMATRLFGWGVQSVITDFPDRMP